MLNIVPRVCEVIGVDDRDSSMQRRGPLPVAIPKQISIGSNDFQNSIIQRNQSIILGGKTGPAPKGISLAETARSRRSRGQAAGTMAEISARQSCPRQAAFSCLHDLQPARSADCAQAGVGEIDPALHQADPVRTRLD